MGAAGLVSDGPRDSGGGREGSNRKSMCGWLALKTNVGILVLFMSCLDMGGGKPPIPITER